MKYMNPGQVLFGCLLFSIGLVLVLNSLLGFELPVARTIFGLILLYWGLSAITGAWSFCGSYRSWEYQSRRAFRRDCTGFHQIRKENAHIRITDDKIVGTRPKLCFDTRAGQTMIDLTPLTQAALLHTERPLEIRSSTRAGQTVFTISKAIPVEIHAQTGWGDTHLPDGSHKTMGQSHYRSHPDSRPLIVIYTQVRMGSVEFVAE